MQEANFLKNSEDWLLVHRSVLAYQLLLVGRNLPIMGLWCFYTHLTPCNFLLHIQNQLSGFHIKDITEVHLTSKIIFSMAACEGFEKHFRQVSK